MALAAKIKKAFFYSMCTLSAALTAAFVYYGFVNTDWQERERMKMAINLAVAQAVQETQ